MARKTAVHEAELPTEYDAYSVLFDMDYDLTQKLGAFVGKLNDESDELRAFKLHVLVEAAKYLQEHGF